MRPLRIRPAMNRASQKRMARKSPGCFGGGIGFRSGGTSAAVLDEGVMKDLGEGLRVSNV